MSRIVSATILSLILVGFSFISNEFGDANFPLQTWLGAFLLPLWSVGVVSLWHDVGRHLWSKRFEHKSNKIQSLSFVTWMSLIFTYLIWIHISLFATQLLFVLPFLGYFFSDYLTQDWTLKPQVSKRHLVTLFIWGMASYWIYWFLTFVWIVVRVLCVECFDNGVVYYIQ